MLILLTLVLLINKVSLIKMDSLVQLRSDIASTLSGPKDNSFVMEVDFDPTIDDQNKTNFNIVPADAIDQAAAADAESEDAEGDEEESDYVTELKAADSQDAMNSCLIELNKNIFNL